MRGYEGGDFVAIPVGKLVVGEETFGGGSGIFVLGFGGFATIFGGPPEE